MKSILKHIMRNIWEKKGRSLLIILSLTIATTVFVLNLTLPQEIVLKVQETLRQVYGDCDLSVAYEDENGDMEFGEYKDEIISVKEYQTPVFVNNKPALFFGFDNETAKNLKLLGEDVTQIGKDEIIMSKTQAEAGGYKEGDILEISVDDNIHKLKIVKIVEAKGLMSLELDYLFFVGNVDKIIEIQGNDRFECVYIDVKDDSKIEDFITYIKENNQGINVEKLADIESIESQMSFVNYIMLMVFLMATIMIFFVVGSMNKVIIAERMPVIGTFRSVGATRGKMNGILLGENMLYGVIGGIAGSLIAYSVNSGMAGLFVTTSGVSLSEKTSAMSPVKLILGVLFAVLLQFFITFKAIRKANKKPIKDIIFDVQSTRYIIRKKRWFIGPVTVVIAIVLNMVNFNDNVVLTLLAITLLMIGTAYIVPLAMRGISKLIVAFSKKISWSIGTVAGCNMGYSKMLISSARLVTVSVALMVAILAASTSFSKMFESFKYIWDMDIIVQNLSKPASDYEKLKDVDGVESVEFLYYYIGEDISVTKGKEFASVPVVIGLEKECAGIVSYDYDIENLAYDEILIDEVFAEKSGIEIGDILKLKIEHVGKELEYKAVGFVNASNFSTSRNVCVVNMENYIDYMTDIPVWAQIVAEEGTDLEKLKEDCVDSIKEVGVKAQTFDEYIAEQEASTSGIMSIFYVIIGMAVMLSFIGIINNLSIGFIQRRKEIAVLNSTCMSKKQLLKMMMAEVMLTSLFASGIGVLTGYISVGMIDKFMRSIGTYVDVVFDFKTALVVVGIILILSLFTLLIPAKRLRRMKIVNEIKYE